MSRVVSLNPTMKGAALTKIAIALALGGDFMSQSLQMALLRYGEDSLPYRVAKAGGFDQIAVMKAEVAAGATVAGNWATLLTDTDAAAAEFFALVRERSLIGRIAGLRRTPLRTRLVNVASGFSAAWVGEGQAAPISAATYASGTLPSRKLASLTVVTKELIESSDPAAEGLIRDDLVGALVAALDATFIDPSNAGSAGVKPEAINYGSTSIASTGDGLDDLRNAIEIFGGDLERAVLIGSPSTFAKLHDPVLLPGLGVRGGSALGIPAIASKAAGDTLTLLDPGAVAYGQGDMNLRTATQATIEMLDSGTAMDSIAVVPGAAASTVSLWQTGSVAIMIEQAANWELMGSAAAVRISGVAQS